MEPPHRTPSMRSNTPTNCSEEVESIDLNTADNLRRDTGNRNIGSPNRSTEPENRTNLVVNKYESSSIPNSKKEDLRATSLPNSKKEPTSILKKSKIQRSSESRTKNPTDAHRNVYSKDLESNRHNSSHIDSESPTRDSDSLTDTESQSTHALAESPQDSLNSLLADSQDGTGCIDEALECTSLTQNVCTMSCSEKRKGQKNKFFFCSTVGQAICGSAFVLTSLISFVFTPLDLMLWEKLNMRPGLPPYDWWADPPDEVFLRLHVFNVTNHRRFLEGLDARVHVQEVGPITYLEKLQHYNVTFNENGTMTYTARRTPVFLPGANSVDLDDTIVVPNLAVLGLASYLFDAPYLVKAAFRFMVQSHQSQFFVERTIREYLWDFRDPVLDTSASLAPGLVPVDNMGILARMYADFEDEATVHIGPEWGHSKFFQLDRFRGQPQLPGYDPKTCPDRIFGSTEGVMYAQRLSKKDRLLYWRKSVCRLMPLYFDEELIVEGVPVYRYNLSEQAFDRAANGTDCYDSKPPLPDGLSDASRCFFDFPMVISYPHFYTGSPPSDKYVTGLTPDRYKHNSYAIVEPLTGTPLRSVARMQSNLRIADLSGFGAQYERFSDLVLPIFWGEYNQAGLPDYIRKTIYFAVVVLPPLQTIVSTFFLVLGCCQLAKLIYLNKLQNKSLATLLPTLRGRQSEALSRNKMFTFEKDSINNKYA